jgi:hypothetical protein
VLARVQRLAVFILFAEKILMVVRPFAGGAMLGAGSFAERYTFFMGEICFGHGISRFRRWFGA